MNTLIKSNNQKNIDNYKNILTTTINDKFLITNSYTKINNIINNNIIDIIIADINNIKENTANLCNILKQENKIKEIPILFALSNKISCTKIKNDNKGYINFISHPINKKSLIHKIIKLIKAKSQNYNLIQINTKQHKLQCNKQHKLQCNNSNLIYMLNIDKNYNIVIENNFCKKPLTNCLNHTLNKNFIELISPYITHTNNIRDKFNILLLHQLNNKNNSPNSFKLRTIFPDTKLHIEWKIILTPFNTKTNTNFICIANKITKSHNNQPKKNHLI